MIRPISKSAAGLDVHKAVVMCTLIKEKSDGCLVKESREYKAFHADLFSLAQWLKDEQVEIVAMESTGIYWKTVYEAIEDAGVKGYVVNARHIKNVPGRKTDINDSEWIAELARCGLLKPSYIPPKDIRQLRLLTRYRTKLIGMLSAEKNRVHKILETMGIKLSCVVSSINGVSATRMIEAILSNEKPEKIAEYAVGTLKKKKSEIIRSIEGYHLSDRDQFLLKKLSGHIQWIMMQLSEIDKQIVLAMEPYDKQWKILQALPGVNMISAAMLLSEIGVDMSSFKKSNHFCSWAGMCPGNNESAGKRKSGKTRKANRYLRSLMCEVANAAIKTNSQFKGKYRTLVVRRGHKRAVVAVGHKMLKLMYLLLKTGQPYKDPGIDYESLTVKKNAPRWIKALKEYGYLKQEKILEQPA